MSRLFALLGLTCVAATPIVHTPTVVANAAAIQPIDLAQRLSAGQLRAVNRRVTPLKGDRTGVHVDEKAGNGVAWIEGTDFSEGTIDIDVRGRDVVDRSYLGIALHRKDDAAYESGICGLSTSASTIPPGNNMRFNTWCCRSSTGRC